MGALYYILYVYIVKMCMNLHTHDTHVLYKKLKVKENPYFWHALALFETTASIHRRQI